MKRLSLRAAVLALAAALIAGCGGGGDPAPAEPGAGTPPPNTAFTAAQRADITGRVAIKYEELVAAGSADPLAALRDWTAQQPEFSDTGIDEHSLWARFTDGRYFVYYVNWTPVKLPEPPAPAEPEPEFALAAASPAVAMGTAGRARALAAAPSAMDVPDSNQAVFLRLAPEEFEYADGVIQRMSAALRKRGWRTHSGSLTLPALKEAANAGLLFVTSHASAYGPFVGAKLYSFMTDTEANDANELIYESDLQDGSIIYTRERNLMQRLIGMDIHRLGLPHYAATPKFVRKYMKLAPRSLVVLAMCNAGTSANADMPQAFLDVGAGSAMVWDGFSNPIGYRTPELLIDRMTGANQRVQIEAGVYLDPPAVPNRAFHRADVWAFLEKKGLLAQPGVGGHGPATIRLVGDGFTLANPVISHLQMTGKDRLMIYGQFGAAGPLTVKVGGLERVVAKRADDGTSLEVPLPPGNDDVGEVVVDARGRKSNPRQLVGWRGDLHLILRTEGGIVEYLHESTVHVHLRGDPHAVRSEVDGPLQNNMRILSLSSDSSIDWKMSTPYACENCSVQSGHKEGLQPKFDLDSQSPYPPDYSQPQINPMLFSVDVLQNRLGFFGFVGPNEYGTYQSPGRPPGPEPLRSPDLTHLTVPWDPAKPNALFGVVPLTFGFGQSVPPGQLEWFDDQGPNHWSDRHTVKWDGLSVYPAVDDRIGR